MRDAKNPIGINIDMKAFSHLLTLVFYAANPFKTMKTKSGKIEIQMGMKSIKKLI